MISKGKVLVIGIMVSMLVIIVACGEEATPLPAPTPTPVDTSALVQQAVEQALAAFPTPARGAVGPTAAETAAQVEAAVQAAVQAAVAAIPAPSPGVAGPTAAEIAAQVQAAVVAAVPAGVSPEQIQSLVQAAVGEAVASLPTPVATPVATPAPPAMVEPSGIIDVGVSDLGTNINVLHNQPLSAFRFDNLVTHEHMFATTSDNQVENRLVEDWTVDSSGLVYTVNLRQGVPWHRGYGDFNADDFIWSINDVGAPGSPHAASGYMRQLWTCDGCEMVKLDDSTVQLTRPSPTFQITWYSRSPRSGSVMALHSKLHFDTVGEEKADRESVGTGPWIATEFKSGISRTVDAVRNHWRKTPEFAHMVWWEIQESETRVANFMVGRLDTGQFTSEQIQTIKKEALPEVKYMQVPGGATIYLNFLGQQYQTDHPAHLPDAEGNIKVPLGDNAYDCTVPYVACDRDLDSAGWEKARKVRLALSLSIDRQKLLNNLAFGEGEPWGVQWWLGQSFRMKQQGLDELKFDYDPERAKELLVEAGAEGMEIRLALSEGYFPGVIPVLEAVGTMWEGIGIKTSSFQMPFSAYRPKLVNRTAKAVHPLGDNPSLSPLASYNLFFSPQSGLNLGFEHPWFTAKLEEASDIMDDDARWKVLGEMGQWIFDNVMVLPLYRQATVAPVGPEIDVWPLQALGSTLLNNYEFVPHRQ